MALQIIISQADRESAFGDQTDDELADIDIDASIARLDALTAASVKLDYPDAEIEMGDGFRVFPEDDSEAQAAYSVVSDTAAHIHQRGDWIVYR